MTVSRTGCVIIGAAPLMPSYEKAAAGLRSATARRAPSEIPSGRRLSLVRRDLLTGGSGTPAEVLTLMVSRAKKRPQLAVSWGRLEVTALVCITTI
jgi:hypothetical protein